MNDKKRGLGRGLQDLLASSEWLKREDIQLFYCPVHRLMPNPYQPRQVVQDAHLDDLIASVREKGVIQPILATRTETPDQYQILAGERRWQAARLAGLAEVPVLLRDTTPAEVLELALIENIQRRDLNCIEEALAYQRLHEEFHLTQDEIARRVGKNRATVSNLLRLLKLPNDIQHDVLNGSLTMGHARALLSLPTPDRMRQMRDLIHQRHLSVRQTEQLATRPQDSAPSPRKPQPPHWLRLQDRLQKHFQTEVLLKHRGKRGTLTIPFNSDDELQRLIRNFGIDETLEKEL
jgi:ParB family transcriptional regulator, chromosome partitioning protein